MKKAFVPFNMPEVSPDEMLLRSQQYYESMDKRRSLRMFSDLPVAREVIENIIMTASTAPSGAHKQPWTFCAVGSPAIKKEIRLAAEKEEYENYHGRMPDTWLEDLEKFDTDWHKPFLETVPWLIIVFRRIFDIDAEGKKQTNYYVNESVGLAAGFLLTAIHQAGLVALTHTPSPMNFLANLLKRPENEKPFLLIPVGYPAKDAEVPVLNRKSLEEVSQFYD